MIIRTTYKGRTGAELLALCSEDCTAVKLGNQSAIIIPRTMPSANVIEIASIDDATHVSVEVDWEPLVVVTVHNQ